MFIVYEAKCFGPYWAILSCSTYWGIRRTASHRP